MWFLVWTGLVPKNESSEVVNRFLDLAASEFDHEDVRPRPFPTFSFFFCVVRPTDSTFMSHPALGQTGNARDVTMQAGKERASLPLMRRFNEHSEKLLKASESSYSSCVFFHSFSLCSC